MSFSSSSSFPVVVPTPENAILDNLSQVAADYATKMYDWATQVYNQTSTLTDQVINNYLNYAQQAGQFGQDQISRYENVFQPQENQLIQDANTYSSAPRIASEMGRAQAESMQGTDAARHIAEAQLEQFGVDPSAGRYRGLEQASAVQAGAAAAAAGTNARLNTEATGRQLRGQAIAVGQNYPAQAINAMNAGYQGLAGAVNSKLAAANTGAALMSLPKGYLDTAMQLKLPPVGNVQNSRSSAPGSGGGQGSKQPPKEQQPQDKGGPGDRTVNGLADNKGLGAPRNVNAEPGDATPAGGTAYDPISDFNFGDQGSGGIPDYASQLANDAYDPNYYGSPGDTGISFDNEGTTGAPGYNSGLQDGSYDPNNYGNPYGGQQQDYNSNYDLGNFDYLQQAGQSYNNYNEGGYDNSGYGGDYASYDSGGDWSYKRGGSVGQGGGAVPRGMSPSRGRVTDDVPATIQQTGGKAKLNTGEFVIPQDIVAWKGQEFFQDMIAKARKARMGAPARPSR